ncbi:MAG: hypothetical protein JST79_17935 [Acidobacteria bacterium]|nr:hypothetical protein [Acidobacteriota bacterium]
MSQKSDPGDYDGCWDRAGMDLISLLRQDPVLLDFGRKRLRQKIKYSGEMFPADLIEGNSGKAFLDFFERDKDTGKPKGIIELDLGDLS